MMAAFFSRKNIQIILWAKSTALLTTMSNRVFHPSFFAGLHWRVTTEIGLIVIHISTSGLTLYAVQVSIH